MPDADYLKLAALDDEDLAVLSAYVQDAVLKVGDMNYLPKEQRFAVAMNRFGWEKADDGRRQTYERRRAALTFDRVRGGQDQPDRPRPTGRGARAPRRSASSRPMRRPGYVTLIFAGGGAVRIEVECIEARLADLGAAWATRRCPRTISPSRRPRSPDPMPRPGGQWP